MVTGQGPLLPEGRHFGEGEAGGRRRQGRAGGAACSVPAPPSRGRSLALPPSLPLSPSSFPFFLPLEG